MLAARGHPIAVYYSNAARACRRSYSTRTADPLRILFCGSDRFSIASLDALYNEHRADNRFVESIEVICRPKKRVGRGLKEIREVPIAERARQLSLPLHQINTFTKWTHPGMESPSTASKPFNLIVAVSFGLFIPPRILDQAKYGGLNVHPSLLPDFRGAAPLHHTLLAGCSTTGVTLQTLHRESFDHGAILDQEQIDIPRHDQITVNELTDLVASMAGELLIRGLRQRSFVPPVHVMSIPVQAEARPVRLAPKIKKSDSHIDWLQWTGEQLLRADRVIGPLWNYAHLAPIERAEHDSTPKRIIWSAGLEMTERQLDHISPGQGLVFAGDSSIYIKLASGEVVRATAATLEGDRQKSGSTVAWLLGTADDMVTLTFS